MANQYFVLTTVINYVMKLMTHARDLSGAVCLLSMPSSILCAVLLSCLAGFVSGLHFKTEWCVYVQAIIQHHEKIGLRSSVINPSDLISALIGYVPCHEMSVDNDAESSLNTDCSVSGSLSNLPGVIVWDPISQYPELFHDYQSTFNCVEPTCGKQMKFFTWQDGSHARYNPRCIYGSNGCVLLISRIYRCSSSHLITSCDPSFLQKFNNRSIIPFFLLHKSGVTRELQYLIFIIAHWERHLLTFTNCCCGLFKLHGQETH